MVTVDVDFDVDVNVNSDVLTNLGFLLGCCTTSAYSQVSCHCACYCIPESFEILFTIPLWLENVYHAQFSMNTAINHHGHDQINGVFFVSLAINPTP